MGEENSAKPEKKFKTIYLNSTQKQQKSICETEKKRKENMFLNTNSLQKFK